ncbi:ras-specific guanine nucleotide-releasing factor RalGPS1 isoform X2 [Teleopsis dalmanni]|uniref:ras-specific guanine nucleotide-releasing factor RalGPS1 isoform X2 n=1 Tax=Teleopsis dalmanni TaxID=139649 RepID=UPI0018CE9F59|nr:ras-specific guanine nucleotide-releasing factor RalGPS1 isoform X2 [Teleopsis dalmanni]
MMRYSDISRDLPSDNLRYVELGNELIYKNLREESPTNDSPNYEFRESYNNHPNLSINQNQRPFTENKTNGHDSELEGSGLRNNCGHNSKRYSCRSNGTINGAATISYVRPRKDSIKSVQSCHLDTDRLTFSGSNTINIKNTRRKNSIGCLNTFSSSPETSEYYYISNTLPTNKSQSLPAHSSIKRLDSVTLNALRVSAEELANQITLLDFPIFSAIHPDELTSCAWTKKEKNITTPNIVAFTKRFNHTSFWTVQEILSGDQPKQRAEILTHFIKVAKKLHELNNLHSLFAIVSALQSASIYRLKKTWALVSKKDKQLFERLNDIFNDQNNWENLRRYLESLRLPCIPYLGLFLTDLIYIDLAHPYKGGLEPEQRRHKMNNILRVITNYQQSNYTHIRPTEETQKYLTSIRYIEELQNIFEEDQYKKSLKLEPASPLGPSSSSCSSKESFSADSITPALACLNLSPAKTIGSMRIAGSNKFNPGHRKCRSLGTNIFGKVSHNHEIASHFTSAMVYAGVNESVQSRHPLDDSLLEQYNTYDGTGEKCCNNMSAGVLCPYDANNIDLKQRSPCWQTFCIQGCVRRKTVQKEGRKPAVASWQRYWLQFWANSLVYFPPKSFKGSSRIDFKREPCKVCPLDGWYAHIIDNPKHKNTFELYNSAIGTVYKFRTDSPQATQMWTNAICKLASERNVPIPMTTNLMSFE